ncbi:MAG TPA: muconolactone Delta-isomerase family protein [Actinophytocola sp.]|nr:muconolactone Delta-isomerase family protein [Actinophytocola sp.]
MACFTVETTYTDDRDALAAARPRHREYLARLVEQGTVAAAGPWADDSAGFAIYRVADRAELDRLLDEDPYTTEGVAAARRIHEWKVVLGSVGSA